MQLPHKQLHTHLKKQALLPAYLICGDVPLLVQEARDAICHAAQHSGYTQRELFFVETGFNWQTLAQAVDNFSLFSDKTFIEIRNPKAKFDERGTRTLLHYLANVSNDKRLLIITNKLTTAQKKTRWYKAIDSKGAIIPIWPVTSRELPSWIAQRFNQANLNADRASIALLAELTEGNLLATRQAIEKLRLLYHNQPITTKAITAVVSDNARFNIFDLTHYALLGVPARAIRILHGLHFAGTETTLILWALVRELRILYTMAFEQQHGKSLTQVLASQWQTRKQPLKEALTRLNMKIIAQLLQQAERIDRIIKGMATGNVWQALETLTLTIAGNKELM